MLTRIEKTIKTRKTENNAVNDAVYKCFCDVRSKNAPMSGPLIQTKVLEVSASLNIDHFKASNGWLKKFRSRYNITFNNICGESKNVDLQVVDDWHKKTSNVMCLLTSPKMCSI